jgi:hypothetical protein
MSSNVGLANLVRQMKPPVSTPAQVEQVVRSRVYRNLGQSVFDLDELRAEIDHFMDVLLGREPLPFTHGVQDRFEVAGAYLSRLYEIETLIRRHETDGAPGFHKGSHLQQFRTGELQSAISLVKTQLEVGSRRITVWAAELRTVGG